jgi:hypothetical protein
MNTTQILIGGIALLAAGIVLLFLHQTQVGSVLIAAGAAELGVKGVTLAK